MDWEAVIGLEIHAQLKTKSKLFCACSTEFGAQPNSHVCPVCTGQPGALPVLNKKAVEYAIKMGIATNCQVNTKNVFARKNYFYPDLPKGYQISQFEEPILLAGHLITEVDGKQEKVGITRIHMEEDAGKLVHAGSDKIAGADYSMSDLNRACTPLIEIVSEPDIRSAAQAKDYMEKIHQIVRYLDICDGNMEEGSLRCDANVSIKKIGETRLGTRAEVKNLNSFKAIEKAIEIEIERQIDILEDGGKVVQETRHYDETTNSTKSLRGKEEAHDYRYFPDPDLIPVVISQQWVEEIKKELPELPIAKKERYMTDYGLSEYDAGVLTADKKGADFYEATLKYSQKYKEVANWIMGDITGFVNDKGINIGEIKATPQALGELVALIEKGTISGKIAKDVLKDLLSSGGSPAEIVEKKGLKQMSDTGEIKAVLQKIIDENPGPVENIKGGNLNVIGFLVGQTMKATQGKANPGLVNKLLKELLGI
jgi:aspartyl-tRNA(Asn)/glutamyl-tRNA(Gln) amidotransferase subunit B